ncbi:MAG TPA: DUF4175 family protein [Saprospiraceae bacterium]|nr:DUF4175 family protein [Saprospiraceae bacterium]
MSAKNDNYSLLIEKLDQFIRKYYTNKIIRGALFSMGLILGMFLLVSVSEYYFYFHTLQRKLMFYSFIVASLGAMYLWVARPVLSYFQLGEVISHDQAASIIGNHFKDVKDKLLNILQLKRLSFNAIDNGLINASINQKSNEIKLVPFKSAIDLSQNKKYLRYALPPFLLLLCILFIDARLIKDSAYRLINNNKEFVKPAPFQFEVGNKTLTVPQNEDFNLTVKTQGSILPNEVFVEVDGHEYRLKKEDANTFSYLFSNCQKDLSFRLTSGGVSSLNYDLKVLVKPNIQGFTVHLDYPEYTGRKDESVSNIGDIVVPAGTNIKWSVNAMNTDQLSVKYSTNNTLFNAGRSGENDFYFSLRAMHDEQYKLFIKNKLITKKDSVVYNLTVVPDAYPVINTQKFDDSTNRRLVYFVGDVSDDYGLKSLTFNYKVKKYKSPEGVLQTVRLPDPKGINSLYNYNWDLRDMELSPGDEIDYYFEVYDNDGVNGNKPSRSSLMVYKMPTVEEFEKISDQNSDQIKKDLDKSQKESKKIQEELKKLRDKILQQKDIDWQTKKELEKLVERQKQLEKQIQEAKQNFKENLQNQQEYAKPDDKTQEKQEKLNEMFDKIVPQEMKDLMQQIQDLMQQLDKDQALQVMDQMKQDQKQSEKTMERLKELYKQLEVEKDIRDAVEKLEKLAEQQDKLSEKTDKAPDSKNEELKKEQSDIQKEFDKLKEDLKETEKKNEELEHPKELENQDKNTEDVKKEMDESQENMKKNQKKSAAKNQKKAAKKMKDMAQKMGDKMNSDEAEQNEEDYQAMRQLLENLVSLSFDQENVMKEFGQSDINTPRYVELGQKQKRIKDDFKMVEDSLFALSKRVVQMETYVLEKVNEVNQNMDRSLSFLEDRQKAQAQDGQQRSMKSLNDLALMLSEGMNDMQNQMQSDKQGSKSCKKPGGKPGSKSGKVPKDKISKGQEGLNGEMKKKMGGKKEGEGLPNSKEFAEMAARQAALRKALEGQQKEKQEQGQGSKILQEIIDDMNKVEKDLVNKKLNNETLKRQSEILTKLLDSERAEREREFDNKRKAEKANQIDQKMPASLQEYIKKRQAETELYKNVSPNLKVYYKNLVEEYFKTLKSS